MMRTVDRLQMRASPASVFQAAMDVEQWPVILSHYRWVRLLERTGERATVEMAAWRPFGPLRYPTWWVSEMWLDRPRHSIHYRHVRGITAGMDVVWQIEASGPDSAVSIVHEWSGPNWPLVGPIAARGIIGPLFVHGIASRTLAGIARYVESAGPAGGRSGGP
jgi:coenzyme Q-binding protein COQ10